jgi:hypothetical protein
VISVLVPQNRPGGLDVLFSGLANQTLPRSEFELVLIDDLRAFRGHLVVEHAREYDLNVQHVGPYQVPTLPCGMYEPGHYQRALNTGLAQAKGGTIVVLCDYTYLAPDCLERHAVFQSQHHRHCLMGRVHNVDIKPLMHPGFPERYGWFAMGHDPAQHIDATNAPSYQPWMNQLSRFTLAAEWLANYEADLSAGKLDSFMWSVFDKPVTPETDIASFRVWQTGRDLPDGPQHHQICYLKNDSFRTEDLLAVRGWDEELDGCHGHQDSELAGRLDWQLNQAFWMDRAVEAYLFDPHGVAIIRGNRKPEHHNLTTYNKKWAASVWEGGAEFDLTARRKELHQ